MADLMQILQEQGFDMSEGYGRVQTLEKEYGVPIPTPVDCETRERPYFEVFMGPNDTAKASVAGFIPNGEYVLVQSLDIPIESLADLPNIQNRLTRAWISLWAAAFYQVHDRSPSRDDWTNPPKLPGE
jgi:hypothetical protein